MKKDNISLCMIVCNEATNLRSCLEAVKDQVDEIIIVDTGSQDNTLEIAYSFTTEVYKFQWVDDFSLARNFAISKARSEWIICLDADEILCTGSVSLRELAKKDTDIEAYLLPIVNYSEELHNNSNTFLVLRFFKNSENYRFNGKIHEQVVITNSSKVAVADSPIISHKPLSKKERNYKRNRNLKFLKEAIAEQPDNPFHNYYLGVEWLILGNPHKALPFLKHAYLKIPQESIFFIGPTVKYLCLCYKFVGLMDEALILAMEGAKKFPTYTDLFFLAGCILEEMQEWSIAIKWFKQAINNGPSDAVYSRLEGSDSYVAYYHLGYCQAKMRLYEEAIQSYQTALKINKSYFYPVLNLFMVLTQTRGIQETFNYFNENFDLTDSSVVLLVAELFFKTGYPDWAIKFINLYKNTAIEEKLLINKAKYALYSGQAELCLQITSKLTVQQNQAAVYRGIAKFLKNDIDGIQNEIVYLWKDKASRSKAQFLLSMKKNFHKTFLQNTNVISEAQKIFVEGTRFSPSPHSHSEVIERFYIFIGYLQTIILQSSFEGIVSLHHVYKELINEAENILDVSYPDGLGVWKYE